MNFGSTSHRRVGRPREFDINQALDAAIRIFSEKGYHGTSIAELKTEMGLTAAAYIRRFVTSVTSSSPPTTAINRSGPIFWIRRCFQPLLVAKRLPAS